MKKKKYGILVSLDEDSSLTGHIAIIRKPNLVSSGKRSSRESRTLGLLVFTYNCQQKYI